MRAAYAARAARVLNLMKETLTVRMGQSVGLARGGRQAFEYMQFLERATPEDLWMDEVIRGVAVRWNILKSRALYPFREPSRSELMMNAERLLKSGQIKPWGASNG